jgi:hypothetical protein
VLDRCRELNRTDVGELNRVGQYVDDCLTQTHRVSAQHFAYGRLGVAVERDAFCGCFRHNRRAAMREYIMQVERYMLKVHLARFDFGNV